MLIRTYTATMCNISHFNLFYCVLHAAKCFLHFLLPMLMSAYKKSLQESRTRALNMNEVPTYIYTLFLRKETKRKAKNQNSIIVN